MTQRDVGPWYIEILGRGFDGQNPSESPELPNPVHFDTANTSMDLGDYEIDSNPDRKGESWDVIEKKVYGWDTELALKHYRYIRSYEEALDDLKNLDDTFETVILDNWYDFRTLIVDYMSDEFSNLMQSRGWPTESGWGKANELYRQFVDARA